MAKVVSFAELRDHWLERTLSVGAPYTELFTNVRKLKGMPMQVRESGLLLATGDGKRAWFQRQIAEEVWREKLFDRSVLLSISYVAKVLSDLAERPELLDKTITELLEEARDSCEPFRLLQLGEAAFMMYCFWPEQRERRPVDYRKLSLEAGHHAYVEWAGRAKRPFGYHMNLAFEPIGDVARKLFFFP